MINPEQTLQTLALPQTHEVKRAEELSTDTTIGTLTWTGLIYPGAPKRTTLSGTAKSIYEQIVKLNPRYDPWDFADFRADMEAQGVTKELYEADFQAKTITRTSPNPAAAAARKLKKREDLWYDCKAGYGYVRRTYCDEGQNYLRGLGGGNSDCAVNGGQCTRFSCAWDCGIFLCSRVSLPMSTPVST